MCSKQRLLRLHNTAQWEYVNKILSEYVRQCNFMGYISLKISFNACAIRRNANLYAGKVDDFEAPDPHLTYWGPAIIACPASRKRSNGLASPALIAPEGVSKGNMAAVLESRFPHMALVAPRFKDCYE